MSIAKSELPDRLAKPSGKSNMPRSVAVLVSAPAFLAMGVVIIGKGLLSRTARPITAKPTDLRQVDQAVMVLKTEKEAAAVAAAKQVLEAQQAHPNLFYYTRTRIYLAPYIKADGTIDASKQFMTFFDEFDNYLMYFAALLTAALRRPAVLRLAREFLNHAQKSDEQHQLGHITWTERQDMRITVASRKPLFPAGGGDKTPTADVIIADQVVVAIRITDRADAVAAIKARLAYESQHPDRFYFNRARVFTAAHPQDRAKEKLMVFYESDDRDKYRESFSNAKAIDAGYRTLTEKVSCYVLDDPETRVTTWTELQELRVQYASREPLYPYPGEGAAPPPVQSPQQPGSNASAQRRASKIENIVAALQTQDPRVFIESMKPGVR